VNRIRLAGGKFHGGYLPNASAMLGPGEYVNIESSRDEPLETYLIMSDGTARLDPNPPRGAGLLYAAGEVRYEEKP
jgi:hypothetical protein